MAVQPRQLQLLALGPPEVRVGEDLVAFATRKTQALLFYLAIETGLQPREHLATLLWPESTMERSYANLRNTLGHLQSALRRASGPTETSFIHITNSALGLNPDATISLDVQLVEQAYDLARRDRASRMAPESSAGLSLFQRAADCQRGDFLAGFSLGDAPGFDNWSSIQSEVCRRRLGLIFDRLSEIQFSSGQFAGATDTASRWIAMDAFNEVAYRLKMRAHFAAGERGQALETYELCRTVLAAELGLKPAPITTELADRIRSQALPLSAQVSSSASETVQTNSPHAYLGKLFFGRAGEIQILTDRYERAALGQPQLVVLRGEIGIGKTHLARKFLAWAGAQGAEVLQGAAFESGSHLPFQPLVDSLRLRLASENSPRDLLDEDWLMSLSRLLPELHQHLAGEPAAPEEGTTPKIEVSRTDVFEPFTQFTLALSRQAPLVVLMDDLQWMDGATLDFLQYAIRRWNECAARVLLIISLRSEALHPMNQPSQESITSSGHPGLIHWLARVDRELTPLHLELEPLGEDETVRMVQSLLSPPAADFAQWMYDETRGQPFYLLETLKDFLERRVLHPKRGADGQWRFSVDVDHDLGEAVRVPSTIHAVIRSRLNRLSPQAFGMLAGGAVLEQALSFERLRTIAHLTEDLALPALDELTSGRFILEEAQRGSASAYTFTSDMLRDVVYTEAGDARRRLFHRRALEILESEGFPAAVLAYHALAAGQGQAAFRHSLTAGREALHISAVGEAIVHLERARRLVREARELAMPARADLRDLYMLLVRAYKLGGQTEKSLAVAAALEEFFFE